MLPLSEKRIDFSIWTISQNIHKIPIGHKLLKWDKYTITKTWKANSTSRKTNKPL